MDFVDETASFFAWSPKTLLIAVVSILSPWGVDVPCALTYWTSSGFAPASRSVLRHDARGAVAVLRRRRDVVRVAGHAVAHDLGVDRRAARLRESRDPRG